MSAVEDFYNSLAVPPPSPIAPRVVLAGDGTTRQEPQFIPTGIPSDGPDALFGHSKFTTQLKRERPEHRLMLWMRLQGKKPKDIAAALDVHINTVHKAISQEWFRDMFVKLSSELGKDAAETFLRGEEIPTYMKLVELRDSAESEAVQKSACDAILDRIRGKPTVKVETKSEATVDVAVHDVSALLAERAKNEKILKANGVLTSSN